MRVDVNNSAHINLAKEVRQVGVACHTQVLPKHPTKLSMGKEADTSGMSAPEHPSPPNPGIPLQDGVHHQLPL